MLGIFKKFLNKQPEDDPKPSSPAPPESKAEKKASAAPGNQPGQPPPAATGAATQSRAASVEGTLELRLKAILKSLPVEILTKVEKPPAAEAASIPLFVVKDQLKTGSVKLTFGELKGYAPPGIFSTAAGSDHVVIELPLSEVLNVLPANSLARQPQKKLQVPDEIPGLFGARGEPLSVRLGSTTPASAAAAAQPAATKPEVAAPTPTPAAGQVARGTLPPASAATPPAPAAPTVPASTPEPGPSPASIAASDSLRRALSSAVASAKEGAKPASTGTAATAASTRLPASTAPAPASAPTTQPIVSGSQAISIPLLQVSMAWPPAILKEIAEQQLSPRTLRFPADDLAAQLKHGRVAYPWKQIRAWLDPAAAGPDADQGETLVEVPLKWIVPEFLSRHSAPAGRKKIVVPDHIPSPFKGGQSYPSAVTSPAPGTSGMAAAPLAAAPVAGEPTPVATSYPGVSALGQILGQAGKSEWSPSEIKQAVSQWPGIEGVLIATSDGLPITSQLPNSLKAETVAAFLPQLLGKLENYLKEMKLEPSGNFSFSTGGQQWSVSRAGKNHLILIGKRGELLPSAQFEKLVKELNSIKA